jgi:hypothetical protein
MKKQFLIRLLTGCLIAAAFSTACSSSRFESAPSSTPTAQERLVRAFETAFNIPTPSCRHESWDRLASDIKASNQALIQSVAETYVTSMAQGLTLNAYVSAYEEASQYRLALYSGDDKATLTLIEPVKANPCLVSSHLPTSLLVYVIGQTGDIWALGRIGWLEEKDVVWIDDGWVLVPETTGSPNPHNRRHIVWHVEQSQEQWIKSEFSPPEEFMSRLPKPKVLLSATKPTWLRIEGRDQVTARLTLLTGAPTCAQVGDNALYYQTQQEIEVTYERVDGIYQRTSEVLLGGRVSPGSFLPIGIMTQCQ